MIREMTVKRMSKAITWKDWIFPIILIAAGVVWAVYDLMNPTDSMVAAYLTKERLMVALGQHLYLILVSASLAIVTAFPLGVLLTRPLFRHFSGLILGIVNVLQSIPSFAVIGIVFSFAGVGARTAIIALWVYSLLPILNNTIAGIQGVDRSVIDSARGMGMTKAAILFKIEIPLASNVIFAGIRTAMVINIGTAVIATFIGAGGLGDFIISGQNTSRHMVMLLGAGLASIIAMVSDSLLGMVEKKFTP